MDKSVRLTAARGRKRCKLNNGVHPKDFLKFVFTLRLRKDCGIQNTRKTFHSMRHNAITQFRKKGVHPTNALQIAGHQSEHTATVHTVFYDDIDDSELKQLERDINKLSYPLDLGYLKLADPTFRVFFAKEKTAEEKQAERDTKKAQHLKAKANREERNRDKRRSILPINNVN